MPESQGPGPSVKDPEVYEKVREQGASKEKAARIANAAANEGRSALGQRGGSSPAYEDWTVEDLHRRALDVGVLGRANMNKKQLISALRNH